MIEPDLFPAEHLCIVHLPLADRTLEAQDLHANRHQRLRMHVQQIKVIRTRRAGEKYKIELSVKLGQTL